MREYYLEHGFQDYLSKPINMQSLDDILVKYIKKDNNFSHALDAQRLDMLNHFRAAFDSGRRIGDDFFRRFPGRGELITPPPPPPATTTQNFRNRRPYWRKPGGSGTRKRYAKRSPLFARPSKPPCKSTKRRQEVKLPAIYYSG
jgi:hypothetical protein